MPVMTRSCGRKEVRSRMEATTPRRSCRTTVKRKKDSDEEAEHRPSRKKPTVRETAATPRTRKQNHVSKIPRRVASEKPQEKHLNSEEETIVHTSHHETVYTTPVAARTRSYSSLKKSYQRKKYQKANCQDNDSPSSQHENNATRLEDNNMTEEPCQDKPSQVGDIDSSTCEREVNDVEMEHGQENVASKKNDDSFYKERFQELLEHVRSMQERFNSAQTNASKNIQAYDAFIKELKATLEQERSQAVSMREELKTTKNQLEQTQKELEKVNVEHKGSSSVKTADDDLQKDDNYSRLQSMIMFYTMLSGISLSRVGDCQDSFESYHCVYKPKGFEGKAMQFLLTYDKEMEEVQFSPILQSPGSGEFLQKMPKFLREDIYFDTDQVPSFLSKLIQTYKKLH